MSNDKASDGGGHATGRAAWDDAQRRVRERNDEVRRTAKQQRAKDERRAEIERLERDVRSGVYR